MTERERYLNGDMSFDQYYGAIADECRIAVPDSVVKVVRKALLNGDEHLNTIPRRRWDQIARGYMMRRELHKAFRSRGDYVTLAGTVCLVKTAARIEARAT